MSSNSLPDSSDEESSSSSSDESSSDDEQIPAPDSTNITTRAPTCNRNLSSTDCSASSSYCSSDSCSHLVFPVADDLSHTPSEMPSNEPIGIIVESEDAAKKIIQKLKNRTKKQILELLSMHVHEEFRRNGTTKDLVGWLQQTNPTRNFLFYKAAGLRALVQAKGIVLENGRKKSEDMVRALAEGGQPIQVPDTVTTSVEGGLNFEQEAKDAATKAILEKSFLPHRKGRAREYCSLGHRLELPILNSWVSIINEGECAPGIEIKGAYTTGLAAKREAVFAKDSIDFVVTVKEEGGNLKAWGFEAKGRVTAETATEEERNLHYLNYPHVQINDNEVSWEVANEGERFQILQHAYVYDFDTVVLAISDNMSNLIRSTIVHFSFELKEHFGEVLKTLKDFSLHWAYPPDDHLNEATTTNRRRHSSKVLHIPQRIFQIASEIKTINGNETLQGTANLWFAMTQLQKPFPSFLRLIPAIYAFWNVVKGGSDTTTK